MVTKSLVKQVKRKRRGRRWQAALTPRAQPVSSVEMRATEVQIALRGKRWT